MSKKYILALDQGTTSSRSVIVDEKGTIIAMSQQEFPQIFPKSGWVEHDALVILETQLSTLKKVIQKANINPIHIAPKNITNKIYIKPRTLDCIVSTKVNDTLIEFQGEKFYNQSPKNEVIWFYK